MKKWEEERRKKIYKQKIKTAKSRVNTGAQSQKIQKSTTSRGFTSNSSKRELTKMDFGSPISTDILSEEKSYEITSTPVDQTLAFKLLKAFKLQQYGKKMQEFGFGIEIYKLAIMNDREKAKLIDDLKLLPGHQSRFEDMFKFLETIKSQYLRSDPSRNSQIYSENIRSSYSNIDDEQLFIATSNPIPKRCMSAKHRPIHNKTKKKKKSMMKRYERLDPFTRDEINK